VASYRWTQHRVFDAAGNDSIVLEPLSLWWVARAAAEETLQGGALVSGWLKLFKTQLSLTERVYLRWRGDLAESAEVRRAYSGLYGRFMARALLSRHLGLTRFIPLKRELTAIDGSVVVRRNGAGDIPDWLAWDGRHLRFALCEAKGSLTSNDFLGPGCPKCVSNGKSQFSRVVVEDGTSILQPIQWVAATRWSTDRRSVVPVTVLWDPPTQYDPFTPEQAKRHQAAIGRAWLESIAPGMGWRSAADLLSGDRVSAAVNVRAEPALVSTEDDWPETDEDTDSGLTSFHGATSSAREFVPERLQREREQEGQAISVHEGEYLVAVVTRFGIRPVRSRGEFETLQREQDRALAREEPAMLVALPLGYDFDTGPDEKTWISEAGIAKENDLAIFDLRRIKVSMTSKW